MRTSPCMLSAVLMLGIALPVAAHDQPSAVLLYPYIVTDTPRLTDTLIQLTNTANAAVEARCFYEDLTPECVAGTTGESCGPGPVTCSGSCQPAQTRLPFRVRLTPEQPLSWRVSAGLTGGPVDGVERVGPDGSSNQLTNVPPLNDPMVGTLRCVVVTADPAIPADDNVLVGLATIIERNHEDYMQYRAVGFRVANEGAALNRDEFLSLGGPEAEYEGCPAMVTLNHFTDNGPLATGDRTAHVQPTLVLTTCTSSSIEPTGVVAQFLVYNEFSQRFSTSRAFQDQLIRRLANIDTAQAERSIFAVNVLGTLAAQTQIRGIAAGLVAIGIDRHIYGEDDSRSVAYNVHGASTNPLGDVMTFRAPLCTGDCDLDGRVRINELVSGVNIALDQVALDRCTAMDQNGNEMVAVNELVTATNAALGSCPEASVPPTRTPSPAPTPLPPATGPEITLLGLTTADDRPIETDIFDDEDRPVYEIPFGQGIAILVEARGAVGRSTYNDAGDFPDLQLLVSNALGDGGVDVCEDDGRRGGIPGSPNLDFDAPNAAAAVNDLGCRAYTRASAVSSAMAFTRPAGAENVWSFVHRSSQVQFSVPIAKAWAFPAGDTIVAARVRASGGALSLVEEIVVRVSP